MSTFSTFGRFESVGAVYWPNTESVRVSTSDADLVFFLDGPQAAKLRDDLSRAILEAAQASAKAKAAEPEGSPA